MHTDNEYIGNSQNVQPPKSIDAQLSDMVDEATTAFKQIEYYKGQFDDICAAVGDLEAAGIPKAEFKKYVTSVCKDTFETNKEKFSTQLELHDRVTKNPRV